MDFPIEMLSEIAAAVIVAVVAATLNYVIYDRLKGKRERKREEEAEERFERLSKILREAGSEIENMEREIKAKGRKVRELEELSQRLDSLASLKEKQVQAIRQEFNSALRDSSRSSRLWTIAIGAIWFVLGLIVRGFLGF